MADVRNLALVPRWVRTALLLVAWAASAGAVAQTATPSFEDGACPFVLPAEVQNEVRCGRLTVPIDRSDASAGTLELQVAILASTASEPAEPIVYLEGGPGGSAVATVPFWWTTSRLREHGEVIVFDQRGTGYSTPSLDCWEWYLDRAPDPEAACRVRLEREALPLEAFGSDDSAQDVLDLLTALEIDAASLVGSSYGTRLALWILRTDPSAIRSVVLDGVYPPHVRHLERQGPLGWSALKAVLLACGADAGCAETYPRIDRALVAAMVRRNADPMRDVGGGWLDGQGLYVALVDLLYDTDGIPYVPALVEAAYRGDVARWASLWARYEAGFGTTEDYLAEIEALTAWLTGRAVGPELDAFLDGLSSAEYASLRARAEGLYDLDTEAMYYAVECAEEVPFTRTDVAARRIAQLPAPLDFLIDDVTWMQRACASWGVPAMPASERTPVQSDVPTLLLSGAFDPITPPVLAQEAATHLSRSHVVVVPGMGHGTIDVRPCPTEITLSFLADPSRAPDTSCLAEGDPPAFILR